ncbi:MAG TPA: DNA polymerase III subunit gamma/tau [Patescibacteria group bacterium]|jgi:DNA polymerase-3 subunit gamma/tau|nr:DNA polymerase III subunit gamma/tau [Patescibacteria group bacterium]
MGQALYRKYRSKSLAEVVGQEHITKTLGNAVKNGRISHAYLFTGPRGIGKTSTARILAYDINDLPYSDQPHLDIIEIDAASNRRIDDVRDLRDKVNIAPISARYKVYIIDEVHMLTGEAFNALLKTLEEPPAHVVFILATTEMNKLPATIVSRTQRYSFRPASVNTLAEHLKKIADKEKIKIDDNALTLVAEHGDGSFRDSISLLDQMDNVGDGVITTELIEQMLGLAPRNIMEQLAQAIVSSDQPTVLTILEKLSLMGSTATSLLNQLLRTLRTTATRETSLYKLIDDLLEVPRAYDPWLKLLTTLMKFTSTGPGPRQTTTAIKHNSAPPPPPIPSDPIIPNSIGNPIKKEDSKTTESQIEPIITKAPKKDPEEEKSSDMTGPPIEPGMIGNKIKEITEDQWSSILAAVKKQSQPVFVVLRMATWQFDSSDQTLVLNFKFQLHRNKMEDSASKKILSTVIYEQLGSALPIKTILEPKTQKQEAPAPQAPAQHDPSASSVIEMMGGGELIDTDNQALQMI